MAKRILTLLLVLCSQTAYSHYQAEVIKVIDGDSIHLQVEIWPGLTQKINLRLDGVNTPELRGSDCEKAAGRIAKGFTEAFVSGGTVTLSDVSLGKYAGRALGKISVDGDDLGEALLKAGYAREYHGGKREPWCG